MFEEFGGFMVVGSCGKIKVLATKPCDGRSEGGLDGLAIGILMS